MYLDTELLLNNTQGDTPGFLRVHPAFGCGLTQPQLFMGL